MSNDLPLITIKDHSANFSSVLAIFVLRMNDCLGIPSFVQSCTSLSFSSSVSPSFSCPMYFSMNLKVLLGNSSVWLSKVALQSLRPCNGTGLQFVGVVLSMMDCISCFLARNTLASPVGTVKTGGLKKQLPTLQHFLCYQDTNDITLICAQQKFQPGFSLGSGCKTALLRVSTYWCFCSQSFSTIARSAVFLAQL